MNITIPLQTRTLVPVWDIPALFKILRFLMVVIQGWDFFDGGTRMYRQMSPYVSQNKKNPALYFLSALTMDLLRNCLYFHVLFSLVHTFLITSKVLIKLQLLNVGLEQW